MSDQPDSNLRSKYEANSSRAEWFARLILVGLAVEIVEVFVLKRPFLEAAFTIAATTLILVGVSGEIIFEKRARAAGDGIVAEANARTAEAHLELARLNRRVGSRLFDRAKFLEQLEDKPKPASVSIYFDMQVADGWSTGKQLEALLQESGWPTSSPITIGRGSPYWEHVPQMMALMRDGTIAATGAGIVVIEGGIDTSRNSFEGPGGALVLAIIESLGDSISGSRDATLPEDHLVVLIFDRS
jgi:hypothetical protein